MRPCGQRSVTAPAGCVSPGFWRYNHRSWGRSSAGRASRSQCEGRGFDPLRLHQVRSNPLMCWRVFCWRSSNVVGIPLWCPTSGAAHMRIASRLHRNRHGFLGFRVVIPRALRRRLGRAEFRLSLHTSHTGVAKALAIAAARRYRPARTRQSSPLCKFAERGRFLSRPPLEAGRPHYGFSLGSVSRITCFPSLTSTR